MLFGGRRGIGDIILPIGAHGILITGTITTDTIITTDIMFIITAATIIIMITGTATTITHITHIQGLLQEI
jgi:hypothetical protein